MLKSKRKLGIQVKKFKIITQFSLNAALGVVSLSFLFYFILLFFSIPFFSLNFTNHIFKPSPEHGKKGIQQKLSEIINEEINEIGDTFK